MRNNYFKLLIIECLWIGGCGQQQPALEPSRELRLAQPTPKTDHQGRSEELQEFNYGGIYRIVRVDRHGAAEGLAPGAKPVNPYIAYKDGGVEVKVKVVPYGVRLHIQNRLQELLNLDGTRSAMIDVYGVSHPVELRPPALRFPSKEPLSQSFPIPPQSTGDICLDVILPVFRDRINQTARSDEERGAFLAVESPLPVFCSGYFLYPSSQREIRRIRTWSFGREFRLYVELKGNDAVYGYTFHITPYRFADGPSQDDSGWEDPKLTPMSGENVR